MKNLVLIIGVVYTTIILFGCGNSKKVLSYTNKNCEISNNFVVADSTQELGYNPRQRAFAYFLMSLPKEEQVKWISNASFSEKEKNRFLNKIDTLKTEK